MSDEPSEAEVLAYLKTVVRRIAVRIASELPEDQRGAALAAAEEELQGDEGARELLAVAFEEGRSDAVSSALLAGKTPAAPDWSDIENVGERRAIAREEHSCNTCSHSPVCAVAQAVRAAQMLVAVRRCDRHAQA